MANIQHSALTGDELHEPKGADSASSGAVYVADGLGSGDWTVLKEYATVYTLSGDALSVGTIGTTPITFPFNNNGPDNISISDQANNKITLTSSGVYLVTFNVTCAGTAAGDAGEYIFKVLLDGVDTGAWVTLQVDGASTKIAGSVTTIVSASGTDDLTVTVESDEAGLTDDIDVSVSNLSAVKVG